MVEVEVSGPDHGRKPGLVAALRGIEDNIVFRAWCLSRGREVRRHWWRHPLLLPGLLLLLISTAAIGFVVSSARVQVFFMHGRAEIGWLALVWAVPLIYGALTDAGKVLGPRGSNELWDTFSDQLRTTPVSDHDFLVAAIRISWPRLLLAAVGGAALFASLAMTANSVFSTVNVVPLNAWYSQGVALAAVLALNGALAGIALTLLGLISGHLLGHTAVIGVNSAAWSLVILVNAMVNLVPSLPVPGLGYFSLVKLKLVQYTQAGKTFGADWRIELYALLLVQCLLVVLGLTLLLLRTARRSRFVRNVVLTGWPLLLPALGIGVYAGSVLVMGWLDPAVGFSGRGALFFALAAAGGFGMNTVEFSPWGIGLDWIGPHILHAKLGNPFCWLRFLFLTVTQLGLIAILYHYALDTVRRWRRGED